VRELAAESSERFTEISSEVLERGESAMEEAEEGYEEIRRRAAA
jgi:polyhydroxyalkanoate synthesis regulator phasin